MDSAASARQASLREANLGLVLRSLHGSGTALSRADLAARTGVTRATAARLTDELVGAGLVDEVERSTTLRRGRPATPLRPGSSIGALGLQVDVTFLAARVVNLRGEVVAERIRSVDLQGSEPRAVLADLGAIARETERAASGVRIVGSGLALPGLLDAERGLLLTAPNLGWRDVRIRTIGARPVVLGNEANFAALTLVEPGAGRPGQLRDFLYLSGNVGVGGAVVLDGKVMGGSRGRAGEIGHVCVDPAGPECSCGARGCLEQYVGRRALLRAAGLSAAAPVETLREHAEAGRQPAHAAHAAAQVHLAIAVAGAINLLDIGTVVLGGHLVVLAPGLDTLLATRVLSARWTRPRVVVAPDTAAPAATGAALKVLGAVLDNPSRWMEERNV